MDNETTPELKGNAPATQPPIPSQPQTPKQGASGKAIAALILGILSIVCCGFFTGIPAIIVGKQELNAINRGESNIEGKTLAMVGFILGIVGTSLSVLAMLFYLLVAIFGFSMGMIDNARAF